nr:MAG TPA: Low affinity iron permease [Caudoviricetes sp.]
MESVIYVILELINPFYHFNMTYHLIMNTSIYLIGAIIIINTRHKIK